MAFTAKDVQALREKTGCGMMDCKKALTECDGDMEKAVDFLREKGLAQQAKKAGRIAAEGAVLVYEADGVAAAVEINAETDFVAGGDLFKELTLKVAQVVAEQNPADVEALGNCALDGKTVNEAVQDLFLAVRENIKIRRFERFEGNVGSYVHGGGKIGVLVNFDTTAEVAATAEFKTLTKDIAMQIAAMNPIAVDEDGVSEEIKQTEINVAIEKTKAELVQKAVDAALNKAGINPAHVDSEDHMESNKAKGWITEEDVVKAKEIIATVSAEKAASLPEAMIQNIAKGRLAKFLKEVCLLNQEDILDGKKTVRETLKAADAELKIIDFKRFTLRAE